MGKTELQDINCNGKLQHMGMELSPHCSAVKGGLTSPLSNFGTWLETKWGYSHVLPQGLIEQSWTKQRASAIPLTQGGSNSIRI